MMKKIALLIGILAMLVVPVHGEEIHEIRTPEDLAAIRKDPGAEYVLMEDLDMSNVEWRPFAFSGKLNGNGHAILNLSISAVGEETASSFDGNQIEYETWFAGMFSTAINAEISDLKLLNVRGLVECDQPCFLGAVAGYSEGSTISDCEISGQLELRAHDRMFGIGGAVGYGTGDVLNSKIDTTLICTDTDAATRDEQFMGGVFGLGFIGVENCEVVIDGYDSEHGYVHNGGVAGMFMQQPIGLGRQANIINNSVTGKITFFEDNSDRRAYCSGLIGEQLWIFTYKLGNNRESFRRDERWQKDQELRPEMCEKPNYTETVVPADCESYGYTHYECQDCGYGYDDQFTLHAHQVTQWQTTIEPSTQETGLSVGTCSVCGAEQQRVEETLPPETEPPVEETEAPETTEMPIVVQKSHKSNPLIVPAILLGLAVAALAALVVLLVKILKLGK